MSLQAGMAIPISFAVLLVLILLLRIQAFVALLLTTMVLGLLAGMPGEQIIDSMRSGMGNTLGFVATVIGLGAILGAMLERSGGARQLADRMLRASGERWTTLALMLCGFVVAIPVFFDVALIILIPLVYALQRRTGQSILRFGMPLLAGLAVTHSFIPPTPGPIAVAEVIGAELGHVIVVGLICGIPAALVAGPVFGQWVGQRMMVEAPLQVARKDAPESDMPRLNLAAVLLIIVLPLLLITLGTVFRDSVENLTALPEVLRSGWQLLTHPFGALILANLLAWWQLGLKQGWSRVALAEIATASLKPAGLIILLTGAGGAYKQILVDSGLGAEIAGWLTASGMPVLLFAFVVALIIRVLQGSATVAMITAAGVVAPILSELALSPMRTAVLVIAIASGATALSHVNDSGFWMVKQYLGLTELQTLKSWSVMTSLIALCGIATAAMVWMIV